MAKWCNVVIFELPQVPEDDPRSARAARGRVNHNWCMSVVSHGYGGVSGMEVVDGMHAGQRQKGWSYVG